MNILVTGGASGLGLAITRHLLEAGHKVHITYRSSADSAQALAKEQSSCRAYYCDFTDAGSVSELIAHMQSMDLDGLVNNALPTLNALQFQKTSVPSLVDSFQENVVPLLSITQAAIALFRKKKSGRIVTILTSYLVNKPPVGYSEYVANKAYIHSMSKSWAVENAKFNISSNCISPSIMKTGLTAEVDERLLEAAAISNPCGRLVEPSEVAALVNLMLSASPQLNATNMIVNGGENVI